MTKRYVSIQTYVHALGEVLVQVESDDGIEFRRNDGTLVDLEELGVMKTESLGVLDVPSWGKE